MAFRGTFDYSLDQKNRLTVPAKFRAELSSGGVLAKGIESCVALWTPDAYDAYVESSLATFHPLSPEATKLKRYFSANSVDVELDSAGRVGVPAFLTEHAGLDKEVVVTGAGECLEIWDRSVWAEYNADLGAAVFDITSALGAGTRETGS
jgi:MraZ protein